MDFAHIKLLLDVFHSSIDVPHTDKIRAEIMEELKAIDSPTVEVLPDPEPELSFGARKL
jgi:ABC-type uncharacterized transport system YnjBCD ATPase subunit